MYSYTAMVQCVSCAAAVLVLWSGVVSVVSALTSHSHLGFHNASYKLGEMYVYSGTSE